MMLDVFECAANCFSLRRAWYLARVVLVAACGCVSAARLEAAEAWRYVAPSSQQELQLSRLRRLDLSGTAPEGLVRESVAYSGREQRYVLLRIGSPDSQRIAVVVDVLDRERYDLYVDSDRDKEITGDDLVEGTGPFRSVSVKAEVTRDGTSPLLHDRVLVFRRGRVGLSLSGATAGYVQGHVMLDGTEVLTRRVDGDGNGLFADTRDQLWIDINGDGKFDPFLEQLPHSPIIRVNGQRLRVVADAAGERLVLEPVEGEGTLKLEIASLAPDVTVVEAEVMVWGADGSAFSLRELNKPHSLPVGKYTFGTVRVCTKADKSTNLWSFVFSRSSLSDKEDWYTVRADVETIADPVGELRFDLELPANPDVRPGDVVSVSPRIATVDGLLITGSRYGNRLVDRDSNNHVSICATTADGRIVSHRDSGFS
jgi:hypothetical protein